MSQQIQHKQKVCQAVELLQNQWTLWFYYSCDSQKDINYQDYLMQIQKFKSWNQFILLWNWTSKIENFFIDPELGTFKKYKFGIQERKIDSINFYKHDIQPQWEYGDNSKYGYFNFGIDRYDQRVNQIFQASVFLAVGESEQISKHIFGVRIVDLSAKPKHPSRARIQIWVDFRHNNSKQSLQRLLDYQQKLQKYYKNCIQGEINQLKFFNISNKDTQQEKTPKKQYERKGSYQNKDHKSSKYGNNKN